MACTMYYYFWETIIGLRSFFLFRFFLGGAIAPLLPAAMGESEKVESFSRTIISSSHVSLGYCWIQDEVVFIDLGFSVCPCQCKLSFQSFVRLKKIFC